MATVGPNELLAFASRLQAATTLGELLHLARIEVERAIGHKHCWIMIAEDPEATEFRVLDCAGEIRDIAWEVVPVVKRSGSPLVEDCLRTSAPVVVPDARDDPRTNKTVVAALGSRTAVLVPLRTVDRPNGVFGCGTFGDEGVSVPSDAAVDYLVGMAGQIAITFGRLRLLDERAKIEAERRELERRLLQRQKLESLGMLAGGIAHDFNNVLTVIMSAADLARKAVVDPVLVGDIDAVLQAAARGHALTQQLLAVGRSQPLRKRVIDLDERLHQLVGMVRRLVPATIAIELREGPELPACHGDPSQLDQVFLNLFMNACDAMPKGGRLSVATELVDLDAAFVADHPWARPGRYVMTAVTDTGTGMSREVLDRVFEPFFTTKGDRAGTGLGLATTYGIVRQHDGLIHCYSEPGHGTTFKVYLPVSAADASASTTSGERPAYTDAGDGDLAALAGHERVLVAEDEPAVRAIAVRLLGSAGYDVVAVADGHAAVEAAQAGSFDLVLLDVVMPGPPCIETVRRLREIQPQMRVLLTSGYTGDAHFGDLRQGVSAPMIYKPYDVRGFLTAVRRALDAKRR